MEVEADAEPDIVVSGGVICRLRHCLMGFLGTARLRCGLGDDS